MQGSVLCNASAAAAPPDVEPIAEDVSADVRNWLERRHIAACDRGAAYHGVRLGSLLGTLIVSMRDRLHRILSAYVAAPPVPPVTGRFGPSRSRPPPLRCAARTQEFKKSFGRRLAR